MKTYQTRRGINATTIHGIVIATALSFLTGCNQPIEQEPFSRFSASAQELQSGTDRSTKLIAEWARERQINALAGMKPDDAVDAIQSLKLQIGQAPDGEIDPSTWASESELLFLKADRFRRSLKPLNSALVEYGVAMEMLASPDLVDPTTFDKMRQDLNSHLREAGKSIGIESVDLGYGSFSVDGFALFSTLTIEAARAIIENRRQDRLIELIQEHQVQIDAAAALGREAVQLLGLALWNEYDIQAQAYVFASLGKKPDGQDDPNTSDQKKRRAIEQLIDLNVRFTTELDILNTLEGAYGTLPAAHAGLANNLNDPATGLAAIRQLYDAGRKLHANYETLREANQAETKQK